MNLWRPAIWTPMAEQRRRARRGQHWRRRLFDPLRFAAGDVLLDTNGNVILDASGNVMLSDGAGDDCCCESLCPGQSITAMTVDTLSDAFVYPACGGFPCLGSGALFDGILDVSGGACIWVNDTDHNANAAGYAFNVALSYVFGPYWELAYYANCQPSCFTQLYLWRGTKAIGTGPLGTYTMDPAATPAANQGIATITVS